MRPDSNEHDLTFRDAENAPAFRARFERRLATDGLVGALAMLNQRTRFRFTGLYRVIPPELHSVALFDRENPQLHVSGAACGLNETYCSVVYESGRPFRLGNASTDAHPATRVVRESVQSYAGVPIRLPGGRVLGTLCHFDGRPRILAARELAVIQDVAPLLAPWVADGPATS